jgi:hypothetical protein
MMNDMILAFVLLLCPQDKVEGLIERLSDESAVERDKAQKELMELGRPALTQIRKHLENTRDAEVKARLEAVVAYVTKIRWERDLKAALEKAKKENKGLFVFSTIGEPDGYA